MDPMKEAIRKKLMGLKEGTHNEGEMKLVAPEADPHPPAMQDHDGDKDDGDYDALNPLDRAPDLKKKDGDLVLSDNSGPVHDDKGNLSHEVEAAKQKASTHRYKRPLTLTERAAALKGNVLKK